MAEYGWIIDKVNTEIFDDDDGVETCGPSDIDVLTRQALMHTSEGTKFRMYDDDGEFYYAGRILGDYDGFEPLDDYGTPNAGAVEIRYFKDGKWVAI